MLSAFACIVHRDLLLAFRRRADLMPVLFFFIIVCALFPLAVGAEPALLSRVAPGVLWVAALLASMLSLGRLFDLDHADGTLERLLLSAEPLPLVVIAKVLAHWLLTGLPLIALTPLLALWLELPAASTALLMSALLVGTPTLSLLGAIGSALTLGLRGGGVLVPLLVLPLYVPVLIFGVAAVQEGSGPHLLLGALLALASALSPWAASAALRIAVE
ncbi:MAG TPA: heme exporter protein CcmB [Burkholderiaceae bacterium]|jgi:heme exporter protein B